MIYDDCKLEEFKSKADKVPEFMGGTEELGKYFTANCNNKSLLSKLEGKLFIQILIDSTGKPCCKQIANKTGSDISELNLQNVINEMPVWQAAVDNDKKVNFSVFLILNFSDGNCKVTYNKPVKNKKEKEHNIPYYSIEEALSYIDKAKTLNLSGNGLSNLDPAVSKLINLVELNLGNNKLKSLPDEIETLKNLEFLYLTSNEFEKVPLQVGELKQLKALMLNKNQVKSLPKFIGNLKNLKILNVSDNKIPEKDVEKIRELLPNCHIIY
jgi:Leucine-rich repeat (LRR) protein